MHTYLIDPVAQTLSREELIHETQGSILYPLYAALGCHTVQFVGIGQDRGLQSLELVIDDNGRLLEGQRCFLLGGHLFAGKAAIIARNLTRTATTPLIDAPTIMSKLVWLPETFDYTPGDISITDWDI